MKTFFQILAVITLICTFSACAKDNTVTPLTLTGLEGFWSGTFTNTMITSNDSIQINIIAGGQANGTVFLTTPVQSIPFKGNWSILDANAVSIALSIDMSVNNYAYITMFGSKPNANRMSGFWQSFDRDRTPALQGSFLIDRH